MFGLLKGFKLYGIIALIVVIGGAIIWAKIHISGLENQILKNNLVIERLENNNTVLETSVRSLQNTIEEKKRNVKKAYAELEKIRRTDRNTVVKLREAEAKLRSHRLDKMRKSRHAERVLKIINKSVIRHMDEIEGLLK